MAKSKKPAKGVTKTKAAKKAEKAPAKKPAKKGTNAPKAAASPKGKAAGSARIEAGDRAPSFELKDQAGKTVSSDSLRGAPYVLYFYPKDDTSGCTREACGFRDAGRSFGKLRARIIGVSPDSQESHARFAKKYGLPFTLLADPDKKLAKAYGAWALKKNYGREYMGIVRSTFVVDDKGVVKRAFYGVKVDGHVDNVLAALG
jgi:peroxiredoxin Q/BCP